MKYGPVVLIAGLTALAGLIIYGALLWIHAAAKLAELL